MAQESGREAQLPETKTLPETKSMDFLIRCFKQWVLAQGFDWLKVSILAQGFDWLKVSILAQGFDWLKVSISAQYGPLAYLSLGLSQSRLG